MLFLLMGLILGLTFGFYNKKHKKRKSLTLQEFIIISLAIIAILQSLKFIYLLMVSSFENPLILSLIAKSFEIVNTPPNLSSCMRNIWSEFDLFTLGIGPLAVIWLSVKQIFQIVSPL